MASIPASEARNIYTAMVIDMIKESPKVYSFLRSFFPTKTSATKYLTIDASRGYEKIAKDVVRGADGNLNKFSLATEKKFEPPYFREVINMTDIDLYDRLIGSGNVDSFIFSQFLENTRDKVLAIISKIERAIERQCAQVLQTGIVTLESGDNIDFKRAAASMVNLTGAYWTTGSNDPITSLQAGLDRIRGVGKSQDQTYNGIFGASAWNALKNNSTFSASADIRRFELATIRTEQRTATGGVPLGQITVGAYILNCWGYTEGYDDDSNSFTKYVNDKNVILLPEKPQFKLGFAAVPQVFGTDGNGPSLVGEYHLNEKIDTFDSVHMMDVKSAPLPIPTAVDQIHTIQAVA